MKKIKDVFYDMNDILVALIIVALAALVIVTNINTILAYPSSIAEEIQVPEEQTPTNYAENPPVNEPESGDNASGQQVTSGSGIDDGDTPTGSEDEPDQQDSNRQTPEEYSVYINTGSTDAQIADLLIEVGLFQTRQAFYDAVSAAGAEGKLRAGNFVIPSDATPSRVISILTNQ